MKFSLFNRPRGIYMSEENEESLTEVKTSLEVVFSNIRTLKQEIHIINQSLNDFKSTIQGSEGSSAKLNSVENTLSELKTAIQELQNLPNIIREIKQTTSELQTSLNDQIVREEESVKSLNENIEGVKDALQEFKESHSQQESKITDIHTKLDNMSPSIDSLESKYKENTELIHKMEDDFSQYRGNSDEKFDQFSTEIELARNVINGLETTKFDEFNERISSLETVSEVLQSKVTEMTRGLEEVNNYMADWANQIEKATGVLTRIENLEEKAGISTGDLIGTGFDNLGMLRQIVSNLLGGEKADQYIPSELGQDPVKVIVSLKGIIRDLSCIDESNTLNTSEIMLNYSETADGRADRRTLIVNFSNDIRRVLEVGQSVLMDIGQKRMQTRNIIEEIRNLSRQWTSEDDLLGKTGVFMALDLLETLEKEF